MNIAMKLQATTNLVFRHCIFLRQKARDKLLKHTLYIETATLVLPFEAKTNRLYYSYLSAYSIVVFNKTSK